MYVCMTICIRVYYAKYLDDCVRVNIVCVLCVYCVYYVYMNVYMNVYMLVEVYSMLIYASSSVCICIYAYLLLSLYVCDCVHLYEVICVYMCVVSLVYDSVVCVFVYI